MAPVRRSESQWHKHLPLAMAGAASAHQATATSRQGNGEERAGRARRSAADPQRARQGKTPAIAEVPAALNHLSRLRQLADASPQVAQLRRLKALAAGQSTPMSQLKSDPEEEELVQGKFAGAELQPQLQQAPRANNTGLPDQLKSGIESLSGMSMDHVRVHYNSSQPAQLNALAYAQGSDIHLAPGQEQHLPHEAWHVVQQAQGRVRPTLQLKDGVPVNDDVGLEHEADVMGTKALVRGHRVDETHGSISMPIEPAQQLERDTTKEKHGTITPVEQERLAVLQARMDSFWTQRMERAKAQPNLLEILIRNSQTTQATESQAPVRSNTIQAKSDIIDNRPDSPVEQRANKTGMPDALKAAVESISGHSLDDDRVHCNSAKPAQLKALAYSQGTEVHVALAQQKHLPHEAWHVVQQAQGRVKPTMQMKGEQINDDEGLEKEADDMGEKLTTDKKTNMVVQQKGGEVQSNDSFLQQLLIEPTTQLKDCYRAHIDNVPCNSLIQRVIEIDGKKYSSHQKEEFYKEKKDDLKEISRLLKAADFQMDDRTIDGALADERTILICKESDEKSPELFYEIDCKEAYVKYEQGKATREAGQIPEYVTKPKTGIEEIRIEGLIMCIGVIIEVIDEEDKIVGAAGGHFVTPTMLTAKGLMSKGNDFITAIVKLVDICAGKKRFSLYYANDHDRHTKEALVVLEHTFVTKGYEKMGVINIKGSTVSYSLDAKGDSMFN